MNKEGVFELDAFLIFQSGGVNTNFYLKEEIVLKDHYVI